jgi:hypothetical protein
MQQIPHAQGGQICPLHKEDVSEVCHKCPWWTRIVGKNPQSEELVDNWHCAIAMLPMLLVENAQVGRSTGAAMENFRNDIVASATEAISVAVQMANARPLLGRH